MTDTNKQIAKAFVQAQKNFAPALKTSLNPHFKSKYVGLDGCVEAVIDALNDAGIALVQKTHQSEKGVIVETVLMHESGESLSGGMMEVPASKNDAQGYGSALTYARRYSLMAICGIAPEDDDGNAASKTAPKKAELNQDVLTLINEAADIDELKEIWSGAAKSDTAYTPAINKRKAELNKGA